MSLKTGLQLRLINLQVKEDLARQKAIDEEIDRLIPLIQEGGFIPLVDDMVPPEVPFENYKYAIEKLRKIRI